MGLHWTCCECEEQIEEHEYDSDERMCEDCLYLKKHFKLPKGKAREYLADWMKQYNQGE